MEQTKTAISTQIEDSNARLQQMRKAVADLDNRLEGLEARQLRAEPHELGQINSEIRAATEQRTAARELLVEAEQRASEARQGYDDAVRDAMKNIGRIARDCETAAKRFDDAMDTACAALAEIEEAGAPLIRTLLPGDLRNFTGRSSTGDAFRAAFGAAGRLSPAEKTRPKRRMTQTIARMVADARANIGRIKSAERREAA